MGLCGQVTVEMECCWLTVSYDWCFILSGVIGRVGGKTWGELTPISLLVEITRFCEMTFGTLVNGRNGKGIESSAIGLAELFNHLFFRSESP